MELRKLEVFMPTGQTFTIRETNGEDDDIISKVADNKDNTAVPNFLSRLIVSEAVTPEQVIAWPIANKYYLLLKSRIHSLGNLLKFKYAWSIPGTDETETFNYEEDLNKYDADLKAIMGSADPSKEIAKLADIQIRPYPSPETLEVEKTLSTGKKVRFTRLDSNGEKKSLEKPVDEITKNDELRMRNLKTFTTEHGWIEVQNYKGFTGLEMVEIRNFVMENEVRFEMPMIIQNPRTKERISIPLISLTDFFYPTAI